MPGMSASGVAKFMPYSDFTPGHGRNGIGAGAGALTRETAVAAGGPVGRPVVGMVGLGIMGHLRAAGYEVVGSDVSGERRTDFARAGGTLADSAADVAARWDLNVTSLPSSAVALTVCHELASAAQPGWSSWRRRRCPHRSRSSAGWNSRMQAPCCSTARSAAPVRRRSIVTSS